MMRIRSDFPYQNISDIVSKTNFKIFLVWNTSKVYTSNLNFLFHLKEVFVLSSAFFPFISHMILAYQVLHPIKHVNIEMSIM